jgi:hypothetical protein
MPNVSSRGSIQRRLVDYPLRKLRSPSRAGQCDSELTGHQCRIFFITLDPRAKKDPCQWLKSLFDRSMTGFGNEGVDQVRYDDAVSRDSTTVQYMQVLFILAVMLSTTFATCNLLL